MKKKKIFIGISSGVAFLMIAVFLGLYFSGMYVCWGPFKGAFWNQEVKRIGKSYPHEENQNGIVFMVRPIFAYGRKWTKTYPNIKWLTAALAEARISSW